MSQWAKDALQGVTDLEQSRGHAAFYLLSLASTFDANLKLCRRPSSPWTYNHTWHKRPNSSCLIPRAPASLVRGARRSWDWRKIMLQRSRLGNLTRPEVVLRQLFSKGGARPKQPQSPRTTWQRTDSGERQGKKVSLSLPRPQGFASKGGQAPNGRKSDKGKTSSS